MDSRIPLTGSEERRARIRSNLRRTTAMSFQQMPNQQMVNQQMTNQQMPNQQMANQMVNQNMANQTMAKQAMVNQMANQPMAMLQCSLVCCLPSPLRAKVSPQEPIIPCSIRFRNIPMLLMACPCLDSKLPCLPCSQTTPPQNP